MGYYFSLRGWLEVGPEGWTLLIAALDDLEKRATNEQERLYMKGWCRPTGDINWTRYLFYGADVREEGLQLFERWLTILAERKLDLDGFFHAQGEDREKNFLCEVRNDAFSFKPTTPLFEDSQGAS